MHHSFKRALMILNTTPENLSKMLGEEYQVSIGKVDFSLFDRSGGIAHIPMELAISRVVEPTLF